jgi:CMP-N,N'-diacetyllegionaminic acid synthase
LIYCIDIDGVIAFTNGTDYKNSKPNQDVVDYINELYRKGHTIKIFTARGSRSGIDWQEFTKNQLNGWGLRYHQIIFGKPHADYFVDDRNMSLKELMSG